jgi:hypothetical protein
MERILDTQVDPAVGGKPPNCRRHGDDLGPSNASAQQPADNRGDGAVKANVWRTFLQHQHEQHGKVLFTVTELAHVAGVSRAALNVELSRLRRQAILEKYAHGLYGLPGIVSVEALVSAIDPHAYITGHYALSMHNMVTQVPTTVTCFTDRRSPRARQRTTPENLTCRVRCSCRRQTADGRIPTLWRA